MRLRLGITALLLTLAAAVGCMNMGASAPDEPLQPVDRNEVARSLALVSSGGDGNGEVGGLTADSEPPSRGDTTEGSLPEAPEIASVLLTFYSCQPREGFCGVTYSGTPVGVGQAACGWDMPIGTQVYILETLQLVTCTDRGNAVRWRHVDVWYYREDDGWEWQRMVGSCRKAAIWYP